MDHDGDPTRRDLLALLGVAGIGTLVSRTIKVPRLRQRLLVATDPIARRFGRYTAYQLSQIEFIGTVGSEIDFGDVGYEYNPISAAKFHPKTEALDDDSWRRVDDENPRWQWHVHTWRTDGDVLEVFSHYEYRPDPRPVAGESFEEMRHRLREHYNPRWDIKYGSETANYFLGEADPDMRALVDE